MSAADSARRCLKTVDERHFGGAVFGLRESISEQFGRRPDWVTRQTRTIFRVRSNVTLFRKFVERDCPQNWLSPRFSRDFTLSEYGQKLATGCGMNARKVLDGQPGATPVIRTDGKNVTFRFELVGLQDQLRLALRCDPNGNVWAAIVSETERTDGQ